MAEKAKSDNGTAAGSQHTPRTEKPRGRRKTRIGYVVSDKMQKTIVVELEDRKSHPLYGKIIRTTTKVKAHDENGDRRYRRPGFADGDPSVVGHQALASRRDPRTGEISQTAIGKPPQVSGVFCISSDTNFRRRSRNLV